MDSSESGDGDQQWILLYRDISETERGARQFSCIIKLTLTVILALYMIVGMCEG
jgi:hypothetical protein